MFAVKHQNVMWKIKDNSILYKQTAYVKILIKDQVNDIGFSRFLDCENKIYKLGNVINRVRKPQEL